jgi:Fur family transcriptional regulator, ferric uptake regulator
MPLRAPGGAHRPTPADTARGSGAGREFTSGISGLARGPEFDYNPVVQPPIAEIKQRLRELGLRVTAPRLAVLRILAEAERPLSHAEVVALLGEDVSWDRATVYRNLVALVEIGLARVASHAAGIVRYELARGEAHDAHPHFLCDDCGVVSCLPETAVVTPKKAKWSKSLKGAEVQFVGRCPGCLGG